MYAACRAFPLGYLLICNVSPGPIGKPSNSHTPNKIIHIIAKKMEYGIKAEIKVPILMFLSYLRAKASSIAK